MDENKNKQVPSTEPQPDNASVTAAEPQAQAVPEATTDPVAPETATQPDVAPTAPQPEPEADNQTEAPVNEPVTPANPESTSTEPAAPESSSNMTAFIVGAIILALGMIAVAWFFINADANQVPTGADTEMPGFEEDGDPDDPVVIINDTTLTRAEFNRIRQQTVQQAQTMGMDMNDPQTREQINEQAMDTLINTELIRQAAAGAGVTADSAAIDMRFAEIVDMVGGPEALQASLEQLGLTEASLREDVEQELVVQEYLGTLAGPGDLTATEAEVQDLYDAFGGEEAGLPPLAEVRGEVEEQVIANKEQELITGLLEDLRVDAEIEILL